MNKDTSLVIVGSGIKFLSHLTTEVKSHICQADLVLYLVNDPAMKNWISNANPKSESLDFLYHKHHLRIDCYNDISNYILSAVRKKQHVCVVLYGHPSVFSLPGLNAAKLAKAEGIHTKILPGISAEDCLISDLYIDTSRNGCQSFEATDFLINERIFDPTSHLILWQVDIIGALNHAQHHDNKNGLNALFLKLITAYHTNHEIILYEAAQYPTFEPLINKFKLSELDKQKFSPISTLYIPPIPPRDYNKKLAIELGMNIDELEKQSLKN
jgi:tetrapyrrole methylase family protein / MazG family protein